MSRALVKGSLQAVSKATGKGLAQTFLTADYVLICDCSGSMDSRDARGGMRRFDLAQEELNRLQAELVGKVAIFAFSDRVEFVPSGILPPMFANTNLSEALEFVRPADGCVERFIVISDGQPDNPMDVLRIADSFISRIDTVFVGREGDISPREFMDRLAKQGRGNSTLAAQADDLAGKVSTLLLFQSSPDLSAGCNIR